MSQSIFSFKNITLALAAAALTAMTTGCAMVDNAGDTNAFSTPGTMTGTVHGGNQPISNSTVKLYAVGNTGYGSAGTLLATTTTSEDGHATFQFTQHVSGSYPATGPDYVCPSSTTVLYIIADGGDPITNNGTNNNTAAAFISGVGPCGSSGSATFILNEVTTVATVWTLQQYLNPGNGTPGSASLGTPNTTQGQLILKNGNTSSLESTSTGVAVVSNTVGGTGSLSSASTTATPDAGKVNLIANILAACVNNASSSAGNCSTLFTNAVPPSAATTSQPSATFGTAVDTIQAAYYMATNSTDGGTTALGNLYALAAASGAPFQPSASSQPTDWTIGITYQTTSTNGGGTSLMAGPEGVAVDGNGNVWIMNYVSSTSATTGNSITEMSSSGSLMANAMATNLLGPAGFAIDPSNNVWVSNYGSSSALQTSVVEYTTGGATNTYTTNSGPQRLAIDGQGNAFALEPNFKGAGDVEEIAAGTTTGATATTLITGLTTDFSNLAIDSNYNIWVTGGNTGATCTGTAGCDNVYELAYSGSSPHYAATVSNNSTGGATVTAPELAIAIDSSNNIWIQNYGKETMAYFAAASPTTAGSGSPFTEASALTKPEFEVLDGAGNLWMPQMAAGGNIFEYSKAGTALAPTAGFARAVTYNEPYMLAIDPSGNVWVGAYAAIPAGGGYITEIVGAAVPVVTPLAAGLPTTPGGTNRLATLP